MRSLVPAGLSGGFADTGTNFSSLFEEQCIKILILGKASPESELVYSENMFQFVRVLFGSFGFFSSFTWKRRCESQHPYYTSCIFDFMSLPPALFLSPDPQALPSLEALLCTYHIKVGFYSCLEHFQWVLWCGNGASEFRSWSLLGFCLSLLWMPKV